MACAVLRFNKDESWTALPSDLCQVPSGVTVLGGLWLNTSSFGVCLVCWCFNSDGCLVIVIVVLVSHANISLLGAIVLYYFFLNRWHFELLRNLSKINEIASRLQVFSLNTWKQNAHTSLAKALRNHLQTALAEKFGELLPVCADKGWLNFFSLRASLMVSYLSESCMVAVGVA